MYVDLDLDQMTDNELAHLRVAKFLLQLLAELYLEANFLLDLLSHLVCYLKSDLLTLNQCHLYSSHRVLSYKFGSE